MWFLFKFEENGVGTIKQFFLNIDFGIDILAEGYKYLQDISFSKILEDKIKGERDFPNVRLNLSRLYLSKKNKILETNSLQELMDIVYPLYLVYDKYTIFSVFESSRCEGCRMEYGNQLGHMYCNEGCLHDSKNCEWC